MVIIFKAYLKNKGYLLSAYLKNKGYLLKSISLGLKRSWSKCFRNTQNVKYVQYDIYYKYVLILTFPNVLWMLFAGATDTVQLLQKQRFHRQKELEYLEARRFRTSRLVHKYQIHMEMQAIHQKQARCHLTPPPARSLWSIIGSGDNIMSIWGIDCNMDAACLLASA